jgi:hypothetical protein
MGIAYTKEELKANWAAYKAAHWNCETMADNLGIPSSTCRNRILACKRAGFTGQGKKVEKPRNDLTKQDLEQTYQTFKECGGNQMLTAQMMGLTRSAIQSRLIKIKDQMGCEFTPAQDHRILLLDIETAPNRAYFWGGTWKVNINPDWIDADGYVLCWTAKWLGEKEATFLRLKDGKHKNLLGPIHRMLNEAHAVVHYNGQSFDIPTLNKEFLMHGFTPPSPYKQVDLLLAMREGFRFPNNKLDYICKTLAIGEKLRHEGAQLWMDCMDNKAEAWAKMESYNRRDVELLEKLYKRMLPWIKKHPNRSALSGLEVCVYCASTNIKQDRTYTANQLSYRQYHCSDCGGWFRGTKSINPRNEKRFAFAG